MLRRSILCCNARRKRSYADLNGASTDTAHFHFAWRKSDEQLASADSPWIADNVIQHVTVNGLKVGRNPAETLRILDALQTDELCPYNWKEGKEVLKPVAA